MRNLTSTVLIMILIVPAVAAQSKPDNQQDADAIKLGATVVMVPIIASDRSGLYIPDLKRDELKVYEDDVEQQIVFFATIKEPFHVVLMLDTSASTQEKLPDIRRAANAFIEQLQSEDRVKIITFSDDIHQLCEFTADRAELRRSVDQVRPGKGTRLYDAMRLALNELGYIKGRKAVVIFTDGVDWRSTSTLYQDNIRQLERSGVIVYPIRYETRAETEVLARQQQGGGTLGDLGTVLGGPPIGTTPPTMPGGDPIPDGRTGKKDPWELPLPKIPYPQPRTNPYPDGRTPDPRRPDSRFPDPGNPDAPDKPLPGPLPRREDSITVLLDDLYQIADRYLADLAARSGGKLHRADTLGSLPAAFAKIAAELRTQYSIGYYPSNTSRDGTYREIKVRTTRKDVTIRARPGYRAASGV
ncbi:MAG TPA: VWA domain-containing protein [Blastocatellia bacterium]|nr:VWA domain-containing protein [Blastocatellia bacterium]